MQIDEPATSQLQDQQERPYAILRIKRKRNEEPLDGLLVDTEGRPRRKRSRGALNFFKFAETVEEGAWDDDKQKKDLEVRLASLARDGGLTTSVSAPAIVAQDTSVPSTPRVQQDDPSRRYTVLKRRPPATDPPTKQRRVTGPPKVWSTKELEELKKQQSQFTMYDAIPSSDSTIVAPSTSGELDPDVAKFLPLLKDYLKLDDVGMVSPSPSAPTMPAAEAGDNDYVYDVFLQRPTTYEELSANIGTLTNVPDELIMYDSDSESEPGDSDDEDSNAEDWYKNDYPDEEDSDDGSDIFHEASDYEDVMHMSADDSDHEWRESPTVL